MKGSVAERFPELAKEWHPRNELTPGEVMAGSGKTVWWLYPCGHEGKAAVYNRTKPNGTTCPFCANKKLLPGFNDLATRNPDLAVEWHPTLNPFGPDQVMPGSKKKAWWECQFCGRVWLRTIKGRTYHKSGCASCRGRIRGVKASGTDFPCHMVEEWSPQNDYPITHYGIKSNFRAKWECKNGHSWVVDVHDRVTKGSGCKQCGTGGTSAGEIELCEFVKSIVSDVRPHHRKIDSRYEYDIAVPSLKIAIEYNGLYWHSEGQKPKTYHRDKTQAAMQAGWQLIHIWEDEWLHNPGGVKQMLAHKLGVSNAPRLNARSLAVCEVSPPESRQFLATNHIQGATQGSIRLGLKDEHGTLQALMLFRSRGDGVWELTRYATASVVRGGFSRLLKEFQRRNNPNSVVSFSDHSVSTGGLYTEAGFRNDGEVPPDYKYVVKGRREHKFNYRVARFRKDENLKFEEGLTERELADLNGLRRIYDAGKTRWVLDLK